MLVVQAFAWIVYYRSLLIENTAAPMSAVIFWVFLF